MLCPFHGVIYGNGLWLGPPSSLPDLCASGTGCTLLDGETETA